MDFTSSSEYTSGLIENGLSLFTSGLAAFPSAIIIVLLIFMLETLIAIPEAKLYFLLGIILLLIPFYTLGSLCFPAEEGATGTRGGYDDEQSGGGGFLKMKGGEPANYMKSIAPFMSHTSASFYNFFAGYIFGYWTNLNIQKKTENATLNLCYYFAITFFCFVFSVFYVESCSWKAGLASSAFGIVGGMIWAQMISDKIPTTKLVGSDNTSSSTSSSSSSSNVTTCSGSDDNNVICNAFR